MVTVLMSVWNTPPRMLERSAGSILAQTLSDFEFLILDDGSAEASTRAWLAEAASRDRRIRLSMEPHRGLTATLNRGLALASGELIARQDADDWSEPDRLERQSAFLKAHPGIALLGAAARTYQEDETPLWTVRMPETHAEILAAFPQRNPFVHGSVMFRAAPARRIGGYRSEFPCAQDYDFFWRLADGSGAANLPEPLYHYRYSGASVSASRAADQAHAHAAARFLAQERRLGQTEDVGRALAASEAGSDEVFRSLLKQADHVMLAGQYRRAARAYFAAARSQPGRLAAWAKLARLGIFSALPPARRLCF